MTFLSIFNLCLLSIDLIALVWLLILERKNKRRLKKIEKTNDDFIQNHLKNVYRCFMGDYTLEIGKGFASYILYVVCGEIKIPLKTFVVCAIEPFEMGEESDFARRQAEELKEIIEKF